MFNRLFFMIFFKFAAFSFTVTFFFKQHNSVILIKLFEKKHKIILTSNKHRE